MITSRFRRKVHRTTVRRSRNHSSSGASGKKESRALSLRLSEISRFRGIYSRVARKLRVDRSLVSRVARGERKSKRVSKALLAELHAIRSSGRG